MDKVHLLHNIAFNTQQKANSWQLLIANLKVDKPYMTNIDCNSNDGSSEDLRQAPTPPSIPSIQKSQFTIHGV